MKMVKTTVTKSKYTKKCFMCKHMLVNKCYLEGIKLELICIKCAMKGFKFPHEALYDYIRNFKKRRGTSHLSTGGFSS